MNNKIHKVNSPMLGRMLYMQ